MAEIVVSRPAGGYVDRMRSYGVVVDGSTAASLRRGDDVTVTVMAGRHEVQAKLDWASSQAVDLELGEHDRAVLLCQPGFTSSLFRPTALLYATVWRKRYLSLELLRIESTG